MIDQSSNKTLFAKTVTSSNAPSAFGEGSVTASTASAFSWNAKSGYRQDAVAPTGLSSAYSFQKVGDRYYDPALMCFLTRDTELGQLPYTYCGGEPVNHVDPTGHRTYLILLLGAGGVILGFAGWTAYKYYGLAHGSRSGFFQLN